MKYLNVKVIYIDKLILFSYFLSYKLMPNNKSTNFSSLKLVIWFQTYQTSKLPCLAWTLVLPPRTPSMPCCYGWGSCEGESIFSCPWTSSSSLLIPLKLPLCVLWVYFGEVETQHQYAVDSNDTHLYICLCEDVMLPWLWAET